MAKVKGQEHYWFKFDIGAYESGTDHLTMLQDGAYNRLIRHYYKTYKPIPLDQQQIVRISRAHSVEEIAAVSSILEQFFIQRADGWHNKRADMEILSAKRISKSRQDSAQRRWDDERDANASASACANEVQDTPQLQLQIHKNKTTQSERAVRLPEEFIPKPEHYELAKREGVILDMEFPVFRDHFLGSGGRKIDWDKTLNNWIRRAKDFGGRHGTDRQTTQERKPDKPDLSAQADPDCRACYGGGYEHKEGKIVPCGCTRRALAGRPDRQPGGSQAVGDSRTAEARVAEENPGRTMGKAAIG